MNSFRQFCFIIFSTSFIFSQFSLSHSILDFGNVMVGGNYTQNLIIYSNAEQDFTVNPPAYFTVSEQEFSMANGENKTLQITFTPPFALEVQNYLVVNSNTASDAVQLLGAGINDLDGPISGVLSSEYSPYSVTNTIIVEEGNTLIIEPGVTLLFAPGTAMVIQGQLISNGLPDQLIKYKSEDNSSFKGIYASPGSNVKMSYSYINQVEQNTVNYSGTMDWTNYDNVDGYVNNYLWFNKNEYIEGNQTTESILNNIINYSGCEADYSENHWGENGNIISVSVNDNTYGYTTSSYDGVQGFWQVSTANNWFYGYYFSDFFILEDSEESYFSGNYHEYENSDHIAYIWIEELNSDMSTSTTQIWYSDSGDGFNLNLSEYQGKIIRIRVRIQVAGYSKARFYNLNLNNVHFLNCNQMGGAITINNSVIDIHNSMLYGNYVDNAISIIDSPATLKHLTLESTGGIEAEGAGFDNTVTVWNSILYGAETSGTFDYNNFTSVPYYIDEYGHLNEQISEAIDYGNILMGEDNCMGPGLGTLLPDAGMYGGSLNCGVGLDTNLPEGFPVIDNIGDIPQDQGGYVGIQYQASIFDYGHDAYAIDHYSFWREMDLEGRTTYWEYVGEMPAQNFEAYGYTAPTIADSSAAGDFISTFKVIAHTDDEDIYFESEPASGHSIDNLAPAVPTVLSGAFNDGQIDLLWSGPEDQDFALFNIYRNNELYSTTLDSEFVDIEIPNMQEIDYQISSIDHNGNESELSPTITIQAMILGDLNGDFSLNVLDVVMIMEHILYFNTIEDISYGDMNEDGILDILDVVLLVLEILAVNGSE